MAGALAPYRAKRNFGVTSEPQGAQLEPGRRLVVQHHFATRDHYDLRLEIDGVLVSWAVTRGPSANPRDRRLAVRTEDHPLDYADFEGTIPKGEYGGGTVILWEYTSYSPINGDPAEAVRKGEIKFLAHGERMRGGWVLVRMKANEKRENWLLIKERDEFAEDDDKLTSRFVKSVGTSRTRKQIEDRAPAKAAKADDKPPAFVAPQLCSIAEAPPQGEDWIYELKYDGYRLELAVAGAKARLYTRSGLDWTEKFASIAEEAALLKRRSALIDGEAVVLDDKGLSQFPALVAALEQRRSDKIVFFAFDLLQLDGADLRKRPLAERQAALRKLVPATLNHIRVAEHIEGDGKRVFEQAVAAGAEGIVAKNRTAPYASGRSRGFVKIKGYPRTDVVVVGYMPSTKTQNFASLHAAVEEDGKLRYVGGIGTGYTEKQRAQIFAQISRGALARPAGGLEGEWPKGLKFLKAPLRAEVRFGGWTGSGHLRQARFLAMREDLPVKTSPKPTPKPASPLQPQPITHPERIIFPDDGVSKGDIAGYYEAVAERLAPHLRDRPVSIVRAPESLAETFFQRHPLRGMETGIVPVPVGGETYMALDGAVGLRTAAQFGAIELHGWMSRTEALDAPDRLVFDLDPDEGLPFAEVAQAAADIAKALDKLGLKSWPMLSGGKGVHVIAPLDGEADYSETEPFAKGFAQALAAHSPQRFVAVMSKQRRKGRIFVDWLRNKKSATAILPWSLRARPGAPVATPLTWEALKRAKSANAYDIHTAAKLRDPWRGFFTSKQRLPRGAV